MADINWKNVNLGSISITSSGTNASWVGTATSGSTITYPIQGTFQFTYETELADCFSTGICVIDGDTIISLYNGNYEGRCTHCQRRLLVPAIPGGATKSIAVMLSEHLLDEELSEEVIELLIKLRQTLDQERQVLQEAEELVEIIGNGFLPKFDS